MCVYTISDSQFYNAESDCPDLQLIVEALKDVYGLLDCEGTWTHKGNYRFHFWIDPDNPNTIFCNAFILSNPEDFNDSSTKDYSYYFEIEKGL